jgi:hypothetical protein
VRNSHRSYPSFFRQALIATCSSHPGYQAYLDAGGANVTNNLDLKKADVDLCAEILGVDVDALDNHVRALHNTIFGQGVEGRDYEATRPKLEPLT